MIKKRELIKKKLDYYAKSKVFRVLIIALYAAILPICFYLSIFNEPEYNKIVIILGFWVFCIYLFTRESKSDSLSMTDRFIVAVIVASLLTTLRASDLMADQQGIAYTHIEELQRILSAAFIGTFLYHRQRKSFRISMQIISWMIWITAIYQLYVLFPILKNLGTFDSFSAFENYMSVNRFVHGSVYRNPIPCATVFVIGCALPLVQKWKWLNLLLKIVYIPAILGTYARSGWVGAAVLIALMLVETVKIKNKKIGKWWLLILAVPVGMAVFLFVLTVVFGKRITGSVGRVKYWIYALTVMFPARPLVSKLFGNGFYTSIVMDQTPVAMPGFPAMDNMFVTIIYEQGLFGILAVLCLIWRAVRSVWDMDQERRYAMALICACVTGCFYEMHYWAQAGFLAAVLFGVFFGRRREKSE